MRTKNKPTTSKKILWVNIALVAILLIVLIVETIKGKPCSDLTIVTSTAFAELGVHCGVYAKKAKAENCVKIAKSVFTEIAEQYGADIAVQVFQSSIQD